MTASLDHTVLIQLIYTSVATQDFSEEQLRRLLEVSVDNNRRHGITGLLVYSHGTFMQVLEGEEQEVNEVFEAIQLDPRHRGIQAHILNSVREREFSQWHMAFRTVGRRHADALPQYAPFFEDGFDASMIAARSGDCLAIMKALSGVPE